MEGFSLATAATAVASTQPSAAKRLAEVHEPKYEDVKVH